MPVAVDKKCIDQATRAVLIYQFFSGKYKNKIEEQD